MLVMAAITSVFLALAIGVVLGSGLLSDTLLAGMRDDKRDLQHQIGELTDRMDLARHGAHTFWGLLTRTAAVIAAHTLLRVCRADLDVAQINPHRAPQLPQHRPDGFPEVIAQSAVLLRLDRHPKPIAMWGGRAEATDLPLKAT